MRRTPERPCGIIPFRLPYLLELLNKMRDDGVRFRSARKAVRARIHIALEVSCLGCDVPDELRILHKQQYLLFGKRGRLGAGGRVSTLLDYAPGDIEAGEALGDRQFRRLDLAALEVL
jgi:hypothetical protein